MRFELYTSKTVKQCLTAINDRMQASETKTRPALDGWIEKGGKFSLAITSKVGIRFSRTTRLRAFAERESGITIIRGTVPGGVPRERLAIVFGAVLAIALVIIANGDILLGIFAGVIGAALYIPLVGDYNNSAVLLKELRKTLKAKDSPPKS